ncbi:MAG TPA: hypothetical protein VFJ58_20905 [Armatimonadota bacterium]|nr:hypothetical protein [Armatimonadota bacterium]
MQHIRISLTEGGRALSPSQFVDAGEKAPHRPLSEILADLETAREAREKADNELAGILAALGLTGAACP